MVVVNKSTVPIGSGNWVESLVRESYEQHHGRKANGHFSVASNPEFLREGTALHDSLYPDRVVIGSDDPPRAGSAVLAVPAHPGSDLRAAHLPAAPGRAWAPCR